MRYHMMLFVVFELSHNAEAFALGNHAALLRCVLVQVMWW